jgi:hypothetical protein
MGRSVFVFVKEKLVVGRIIGPYLLNTVIRLAIIFQFLQVFDQL